MDYYKDGSQDALVKLGISPMIGMPAASYGARHMTPENEQSWGSALGHGIMGNAIGGAPAQALGRAIGGNLLGIPAGIAGSYLGGRASKAIMGSGAAPDAPILGFSNYPELQADRAAEDARKIGSAKLGFFDVAGAIGARHMTPGDEQSWGSAIGHGLVGGYGGGAIGGGLGRMVHPSLGMPAAIAGGYLGGRASKKLLGSGAARDAKILDYGSYDASKARKKLEESKAPKKLEKKAMGIGVSVPVGGGPSAVQRAGMMAAPANDRMSGYLVGTEEEEKENLPIAGWMLGGGMTGGALGYGAAKRLGMHPGIPAAMGAELGAIGGGVGRWMHGRDAAKDRTIARMQEMQREE